MNNFPINTLGRVWLYVTVFLTGATVMMIELLGTRIIAPFYGAGLYVWSSLISVALIALALGYFAGGRWADRAKRTGLSLIIALAALLILIIPWLIRPVLLATNSLGLRAGAFTSALVLFSPSLAFLGMVGPFAIKLSTARLEGVGASAGSIYAVSTLGSVVGTLFLGFYLFPAMGSREILISLGIALFLLAVVAAFYERRHLRLASTLPPIVLLAAIGIGLLSQIVGADRAYASIYSGGELFKILSERESLYGWVRVMDQPSQDLRLLTVDASVIGAGSINRPDENRLAYQTIVQLIPELASSHMNRALLLGLGAGHMVGVLEERYGIVTDTIEINPAVADAAKRYFNFTPTGKNIIGDARYQIRRLQGGYDLIILDCFTGGSEPAYLLTVETLIQLQSLLTDRGVIALNLVAFAENGRNIALASVARTLAQVFPHQVVFVSESGKNFNDFIFLASDHSFNLEAGMLEPAQISWLEQRRLAVDKSRGLVLTDNFHPLQYLQIRKAEHYRKTLLSWLGADILVR